MLPKGFNRNIRKIIEKLAFPMYVVIIGKQSCTCLDVNHQADPGCRKCLGTGRRVSIKSIMGAVEPDELATITKGQKNKIAPSMYYFDAASVPEGAIKAQNIIVRENEADILQTPRTYRSDSNAPVYYYVEGVSKKKDLAPFLKSFYEIVGGAA